MSWIKENYEYSYLQKICMHLLMKGKMPKHIAVIMDGNRRYATKNSMRKVEGHGLGFQKLSESLQWLRDLNIREASFYAFSIHNFNRDTEEVNYLMDLAREKIEKLKEEKELLNKYEIRVRIIGNLRLLPEDIQDSAREIMKMTRDYSRFFLNVCMAYTSHDEIRHSMEIIRKGVQNNLIDSSDISRDLISQCLYLSNSQVDLLIRTSGETRLSDFMLWQCQNSCVQFIDSFWPDFNIWHLLYSIFQYQKSCILNSTIYQSNVQTYLCDKNNNSSDYSESHERIQRFLSFVNDKYNRWLLGEPKTDYFE